MTFRTWTVLVLFVLVSGNVRAQDTAPRVRAVTVSPDGKLFAACAGRDNERGALTVWDTATRKSRFTHNGPNVIFGIAFSPDSKSIAIGESKGVAQLLDTNTGRSKRTFSGHTKDVFSVAFSPDGKTLATGSGDRTIKIWDVHSGAELRSIGGSNDHVLSVAFSPDGKLIVAACGGDGARLLDGRTGNEKHHWRHGGFYNRGAFFADNQWVLTGGYDGTVRLWNADSGELRARFEGMGGVDGLAFSEPARLIAVCSRDRTFQLRNFTLEKATELERRRIGELLNAFDDDSFPVREKASKELLQIGFLAEADLRRAMKESVSAESRIRARRVRAEMLSQPKAVLETENGQIDCVAFSRDGKLVVTGGRDGLVRVWDVAGAKEIVRFAVDNSAASVNDALKP